MNKVANYFIYNDTYVLENTTRIFIDEILCFRIATKYVGNVAQFAYTTIFSFPLPAFFYNTRQIQAIKSVDNFANAVFAEISLHPSKRPFAGRRILFLSHYER